MKAGGFTNAGQIVLSGDVFDGPGILELTAAHTTNVAELAAGGVGTLRLSTGSIVNAGNPNCPPGVSRSKAPEP